MAPKFTSGLLLFIIGISSCIGKSLIAIETLSEIVDEDSAIDATDVLRFLSTVLQPDRELSESDDTDPSKPWNKCTDIKGQKVCVVAKVIPKGFSVDVTLQGKELLGMKVTVPNPKPVCKEKIPGLPMVSHVCLELTKVDLTKKKACVTVSAKVLGHEMKKDIGCFTITSTEIETAVDVEEDLDETVKQLDDLSTALTLFGLDEVGPDDLVGQCSGGKCSFCVKKFLKVCVEAEMVAKGIKVAVTFKGKVIFQKEIDVAKPFDFCIGVIPGIPSISKACVQIDHIDLKKRSACVSVSFQVKPFKKFAFQVGCFHIPDKDNEDGDQTAVIEML